MKSLFAAAAFLIPLGASAAGMPCEIHPTKGMDDTQLAKLAKVSKSDAEIAALAAVHVESASIASGELETEGGCLIYSFDIKMPGKKSIVEVAIDAGTGKVLAKTHEGPKAQAAEKAADAASSK